MLAQNHIRSDEENALHRRQSGRQIVMVEGKSGLLDWWRVWRWGRYQVGIGKRVLHHAVMVDGEECFHLLPAGGIGGGEERLDGRLVVLVGHALRTRPMVPWRRLLAWAEESAGCPPALLTRRSVPKHPGSAAGQNQCVRTARRAMLRRAMKAL